MMRSFILFLFLSLGAQAINMPVGVTDISERVYDLHMFAFYVSLAIGLLVFVILLWSVVRYRKSVHPKPATFHENLKLEIFWTIVPFIILIILGYPAVKLIIEMYDTKASVVDIQITGYQWKWSYKYLNENIEFFSHVDSSVEEIYQNPNLLSLSKDDQLNYTVKPIQTDYILKADNPVVVPVGVKIRFLTTSADVVHSWWVPDIAIKKDAIPGFINEAWALIKKPGIYHGRCAELCGEGHAYMPISVQAVSMDAYKKWVKKQQNKAL